jgi:Zn-dependent protease
LPTTGQNRARIQRAGNETAVSSSSSDTTSSGVGTASMLYTAVSQSEECKRCTVGYAELTAAVPRGGHSSWIFAFVLITWSLAVGYFPERDPTLGVVGYWIIGAIAALLLFVSVLIHELAHSLVARARGLTVDSITLFIFGGVSNLSREPLTPVDEFIIAVVGPVSSLLLAAVFWAVEQPLPGTGAAVAILGYLAFTNLLLALGAFNLIPGFPLDGGRVFRSIVWGLTNSLRRGTTAAAYAGQAFGWLLIAWVARVLLFGDLVVDQIMTPAPLTIVSPTDDVGVAIGLMAQKRVHQLPVVENGRVLGMLNREHVLRWIQLRHDLAPPSREAA